MTKIVHESWITSRSGPDPKTTPLASGKTIDFRNVPCVNQWKNITYKNFF